MLHHIGYVSRSVEPLDEVVLAEILHVSVQNNARDDITGVLMYHDELFFQILEGEKARVENCYARIVHDLRHNSVFLSLDHTIEARTFADWRMGYAGPDEIGRYTRQSFESLVSLVSSDNAAEDQSLLGLELARCMFKDFTGSYTSRRSPRLVANG